MQKHVLMLTTAAFILACGGIAASAQQTPGGPMMQQPDHQQTQQQPTDHSRGTMGQGGIGRGMMGPMGPVMMMRIIFSLMDSDGDGTISLP